jgi:hypothetical protein
VLLFLAAGYSALTLLDLGLQRPQSQSLTALHRHQNSDIRAAMISSRRLLLRLFFGNCGGDSARMCLTSLLSLLLLLQRGGVEKAGGLQLASLQTSLPVDQLLLALM